MEAVPLGAKVINSQVVIDEDFAMIDNRPADLRTAEVVQDLANNICDYIRVTIDCPSKYDTGFMHAFTGSPGENYQKKLLFKDLFKIRFRPF